MEPHMSSPSPCGLGEQNRKSLEQRVAQTQMERTYENTDVKPQLRKS